MLFGMSGTMVQRYIRNLIKTVFLQEQWLLKDTLVKFLIFQEIEEGLDFCRLSYNYFSEKCSDSIEKQTRFLR